MTGIMNYIKISSPWYIVLTSGYAQKASRKRMASENERNEG